MKSSSQVKTTAFPFLASSASGLSFELNENGSIRRIVHGDIMLNLFLGNELDGGLTNIYLRKLNGALEVTPLIGPRSPATYAFSKQGLLASGKLGDILFRVQLLLAETSATWFWHVEIENTGSDTLACDLIHTQDIGLAHYGAIRLNEYYVSQYIDHCPLSHPTQGAVVASRQNQAMGGRWPWTMMGSLRKGVSFSTDALQLYGLGMRADDSPTILKTGLAGTRLQHEHSMVAMQDEPFSLAPGEKTQRGFFGLYETSHPSATAHEDLEKVDTILKLKEASWPLWPSQIKASTMGSSLFATALTLETLELTNEEMDELFGDSRLHSEYSNGKLFSFFTEGGSHVVMREKELKVLRPHGHLLRSGGTLTPDESALTSTTWMGGVFHSMITQGHVSINRLLSTCHTYLGLFRSHGQRVFVEANSEWILLGNPSAYEMRLDSCRWIYKHRNGIIEVISSAPTHVHSLNLSLMILKGAPTRFLVSHHIALNGDDGSNRGPAMVKHEADSIFISAIPVSDVGRRFPGGGFIISPDDCLSGGDELLFNDGLSRDKPFVCLISPSCMSFNSKIEGNLVESSSDHLPSFWQDVATGFKIKDSTPSTRARALGEIFPWFVHNALIHYLSPRGLEQYSGGGWGTRDVCQGPLELLLALGRHEPIRDLLCRVFRQQNADGDWPQWFMFFDRERGIRPGDSHGDIVYWPLLALAQYLKATGDKDLLAEYLPFFHADGDTAAEHTCILAHVERALGLIEKRVILGTHLAAYGHGDWNDSLQPAKPEMRELLCSSWTVTLAYQTLTALSDAFAGLGEFSLATRYQQQAEVISNEFQRYLIADDVIAGLAFFHGDGKTDYLLHPRDTTTGLSYSLLPMIHAIINGMVTHTQAKEHFKIIREHLLGPDGARLFDRPIAYRGGTQINFQRAESASNFGREIGMMYTHAHLRYCEALAFFGDAERFFSALCQINPIGIQEIVSSAASRQANCYYSSSDASFPDRYEAFTNYEKVAHGEISLEGGWRVYSSGAGICVRLIVQCFLGVRIEVSHLVIDPMIPAELDGLVVHLRLGDYQLDITYKISGKIPMVANLNGTELDFTREQNPYRSGGMRISLSSFHRIPSGESNHLLVSLQ